MWQGCDPRYPCCTVTSTDETRAILKSLEIKEIRTRFLLPFFMRHNRVEEAAAALNEAVIAGKRSVWEACYPSQYYLDEILPHVVASLFPSQPGRQRYLCVSNDAQNHLFSDV